MFGVDRFIADICFGIFHYKGVGGNLLNLSGNLGGFIDQRNLLPVEEKAESSSSTNLVFSGFLTAALNPKTALFF